MTLRGGQDGDVIAQVKALVRRFDELLDDLEHQLDRRPWEQITQGEEDGRGADRDPDD